MLTLLQGKKFVPAEILAAKFHISVRTVYRDIKALCEQGIPISFEPQKGYFIVNGFFLPPVSFSSEEANALLLMESLVSGFADQSIKKYYTSALNKVKAVLRHQQKEGLELLDKNIRLQLPSCVNNNYDYLSTIQQAISNQKVLSLEYRNNKSEISKRSVEPIGLVFYAFSWHLIAWCQMRVDYRDFKIRNILRITDTSMPFTQASHMDINEYMKLLPVDY